MTTFTEIMEKIYGSIENIETHFKQAMLNIDDNLQLFIEQNNIDHNTVIKVVYVDEYLLHFIVIKLPIANHILTNPEVFIIGYDLGEFKIETSTRVFSNTNILETFEKILNHSTDCFIDYRNIDGNLFFS
jgi:hypothetical protein